LFPLASGAIDAICDFKLEGIEGPDGAEVVFDGGFLGVAGCTGATGVEVDPDEAEVEAEEAEATGRSAWGGAALATTTGAVEAALAA
jgi:hypothetical protein